MKYLVLALILVLPNTGWTQVQHPFHSADYNPPNWKIELSELIRVVQFFQMQGYHCEVGSEDGYAPRSGSPGEEECNFHSSDYSPQDRIVSLEELLRLVQIYNAGGYHWCGNPAPPFEDGYCLGSPEPSEGEGSTEGIPEGLLEGEGQSEGISEGNLCSAGIPQAHIISRDPDTTYVVGESANIRVSATCGDDTHGYDAYTNTPTAKQAGGVEVGIAKANGLEYSVLRYGHELELVSIDKAAFHFIINQSGDYVDFSVLFTANSDSDGDGHGEVVYFNLLVIDSAGVQVADRLGVIINPTPPAVS